MNKQHILRKHHNSKSLRYALMYGANPTLLARANGWRSVKVAQKQLRLADKAMKRSVYKTNTFSERYTIRKTIVIGAIIPQQHLSVMEAYKSIEMLRQGYGIVH